MKSTGKRSSIRWRKPVENGLKSVANNLDSFLTGKTEDEKNEILRFARSELARTLDDEEGYSHFFWCVFGKELPQHAKEWVKSVYDAKNLRKGRVIEAFRGSAKTTIVTLFQIKN